ncbi:hypothetical protein AB0C29_03085 [Actinoplanes sp. NPDC048791]|uniref:hypothetical protein n=1 Tax=Actinoplanes sp. NPDC048791 TaxID=3154623 RepID=UPI0033D355B0
MSWRAAAPLSVLIVLLAGCSATADEPDTAPSASTGPVTLANCGAPLTVTKPPARAVTMNQPATEIMLALGLQDRMIGTAYLDDAILSQYAAAYGKIPVLAKEYPSKEKLLEAEPDFVYASFSSAFIDEGAGDRESWEKLVHRQQLSGCPRNRRDRSAPFLPR